ncbi:hypothetical protein HNR77_003834 [Paenibacillus sp. JGP012]|uniref:hypothetical protein n=1 Tax=Paenibacillus sp. JGP012 TaxID=2735914 RepID=UPI0017BB9D0B|nr:hypothetical protein [Paenibacillus sp. JGP012]MBB6022735.1 hypothetical protein [Paenibacillus sp. JGP012]
MERSAHTRPFAPSFSTPRQQLRLRSFYMSDLPKKAQMNAPLLLRYSTRYCYVQRGPRHPSPVKHIPH